jgi:hypothetical protein
MKYIIHNCSKQLNKKIIEKDYAASTFYPTTSNW